MIIKDGEIEESALEINEKGEVTIIKLRLITQDGISCVCFLSLTEELGWSQSKSIQKLLGVKRIDKLKHEKVAIICKGEIIYGFGSAEKDRFISVYERDFNPKIMTKKELEGKYNQ